MDFRAPHPLVHPSHAGHPYYYPGTFLSFLFFSFLFFSLSLSYLSFESLFAWILSGKMYEWKSSAEKDARQKGLFPRQRESTCVQSPPFRRFPRANRRGWLSPKFLASTIDVRCSRMGGRVRGGEKRDFVAERKRREARLRSPQNTVHTGNFLNYLAVLCLRFAAACII